MSNTQNKTKLSDQLGTWLVSLLFLLIGAIILYFSLNSYLDRQHIIDHGVRTEATVLDAVETGSSGQRHRSGTRVRAEESSYYLDLSFTETRGCPQRVLSGRYDYKKRGSKVQIAYLKENPQQLEIIPPKHMTLMLIFAGVGACFCILAPCVLAAEIRRRKNS